MKHSAAFLQTKSRLTRVVFHESVEQNQIFHIFSSSPQSVFLFLPQVKVSLDDGPDVLRLVVRQLGEIQALCCRGLRHDEERGTSRHTCTCFLFFLDI